MFAEKKNVRKLVQYFDINTSLFLKIEKEIFYSFWRYTTNEKIRKLVEDISFYALHKKGKNLDRKQG
jgi:hypothetical protein